MNWLFQAFGAVTEDLEAVDGSADASALVELFQCDRVFGVDAALVDPVLETVEVDGCHVDRETGCEEKGLIRDVLLGGWAVFHKGGPLTC